MIIGDLSEATRVRFRALDAQSSVRTVADAFADPRLGLVLVCDDAGRAIGVVSKSDLVRHMAAAKPVEAPVTGVMTRPVISAMPGDDLGAAWTLMVTRRLQSLPLLGRDRRPVGTLDIRDALQAILRLEQDQEAQLVNYIAGVGYR